ncbi:TetR/AcrR family transcriptional regulator [Nocardioides sp. SYSU DS0651]|uniref:TetR/AcrR family transcriptional regulator n=1 Tax=Nocardioides sp. SYSU DS0651 TaxID=3415955 RepID=UPI003F4BD5A2
MPSKVKSDGRTTRWDDHRAQRRSELVQAAVRAIDRLGPDASIADIAAEAGVSKPVLYRYFSDKAELHAAVGTWGAELVLERVVEAVLAPAAARDRVNAGVAAYLDTIAEHPQSFLLLSRQHAGGVDPLADGKSLVAAKLARLLGDSLRALGGDAGAAEPWAHAVVGLGTSVGQWWLERRTMSRSAVVGYLGEFIWHALSGAAEEYGVQLADLDPQPDVTPIRKEDRR